MTFSTLHSLAEMLEGEPNRRRGEARYVTGFFSTQTAMTVISGRLQNTQVEFGCPGAV